MYIYIYIHIYVADFNNKWFIYGYLFVSIKIVVFPRTCVAFVDLSSSLSRQKKKKKKI
jgi:hypothetical protein